MPNNKISMSRIRQILRCFAAGNGSRTIASVLDMSRTTVRKYIDTINRSGLSVEEVLAMEDQDLYAFFNEDPRRDVEFSSERHDELMKLIPGYAKRLRRKGVTRTSLYNEYRQSHPDGYSRSRFFAALQLHTMQSAPVAHIEHKAGDKMYVDYAGDKLSIIDRETGEKVPVEVFVAILPCSQLTFVEAVLSQKKEDLIRGCEDALYFYGGAPKAIVPDNLKAAVSHPNRYESVLNEDFASFAEHYGMAVMPARVRRPKDKALVEGAVKLIYRTIYPQLEGREFYSLESLNAAIRSALEMHNNAPLTGRSCSRREQFEEFERSALGPVNPLRFEVRQHHEATVLKNGYVRLDKHYYSVPYKLAGKKVNILYDSSSVSVFHRFELVASHERSSKPYAYTTVTDHLPPSQKGFIEQNVEDLLKAADEMGPAVRSYIYRLIESKTYPELAYKSCMGILSLGKKVGVERLSNACRWAERSELYSYQAIENILRNRQDSLPLEEFEEEQEIEVHHENIRGKEYYK